MRRRIVHSFAEILWFCILSGSAFAQLQEPSPKLNYDMIPDFFQLPPGEHLIEPAGVAVNSKGHIYVFHRGKHPLMEFDSSGKFIRSIADDLFVTAHVVRIDPEDNIWTTVSLVLWCLPSPTVGHHPGKDPAGRPPCFDIYNSSMTRISEFSGYPSRTHQGGSSGRRFTDNS